MLVVIGYFMTLVEAYAIPNQEAKTVMEVLIRELMNRFGVFLELHSDHGRNFESGLFPTCVKGRVFGKSGLRHCILNPME